MSTLPPSPPASSPFFDVSIPATDAEVALGGGLQLITVSTLARHLGLINLCASDVRMLLRALQIPILHLGPNQFVDFAEFVLAVKAALSPGSPDFYVPIRRANGRGPYAPPADCRIRSAIPAGTVASTLPDLCQRILASRELRGQPTQTLRSVRSWLSEAADRIVMSISSPPPAIRTPTRRRRTDRQGNLPPLPPLPPKATDA